MLSAENWDWLHFLTQHLNSMEIYSCGKDSCCDWVNAADIPQQSYLEAPCQRIQVSELDLLSIC